MIRLCAFSDEAASDAEGQIAALKRNGISLTEIRNVCGKNVKDFTLEETAETRKKFNDRKVWEKNSSLQIDKFTLNIFGEPVHIS